MEQEPQETEMNPSEDLMTFEELPADNQELHLVAEETGDETDKDWADLDEMIGQKSSRAISGYQRDPGFGEG